MRKELPTDISELKRFLYTNELFPSGMLDDMISDYLNNPKSQDIWITAVEEDIPISIGFCAPEPLIAGTFNLYAIGVRKDFKGKGLEVI